MMLRKTETFLLLSMSFVATNWSNLSVQDSQVLTLSLYTSIEPINLPAIFAGCDRHRHSTQHIAHKSSDCFSICTKCHKIFEVCTITVSPVSGVLQAKIIIQIRSTYLRICCVFTHYCIRSNKQCESDFKLSKGLFYYA